MHLRNKKLSALSIFLLLCSPLALRAQTSTPSSGAAQQAPAQTPPASPAATPPQPATVQAPASGQQPSGQPAHDAAPGEELSPEELQGPPSPTPPSSTSAPNQPGNTVQVPQDQGKVEENNGAFVFKKNVEEVVLHATVVDERGRLITTLDRNAFSVFEDGKPQPITSFRREDVPVALGIVIDNSGSMRDKRAAVNQAALNLVRASNPRDLVFVVNFNDEAFLDADFTPDINKLQEGLEKIESRGGTALYDAVVASSDHLGRCGCVLPDGYKIEKKVLLVVTDGADNASRDSLAQAIRRLQDENGPTVYSIGLMSGDDHPKRAKRALQQLAEQTGGVAFFPGDLGEVDSITRAVAHDIRNQYIIGYKKNPVAQTGYRVVRVEAHAHGYGKLQVRTRSGYYAGQERASR